MFRKLALFLTFLALPALAGAVDSKQPTHEQIKNWWKLDKTAKAGERLVINRVDALTLEGGEKAYIVSALFPDREQLYQLGIILVRPKLGEARQTHVHAQVNKVMDLDRDGVSDVWITAGSSGMVQVECSLRETIEFFRDWQPWIRFERKHGFLLDIWNLKRTRRTWHSRIVKWIFADIDGDGNLDLIEFMKFLDRNKQDLKWKTKVNAWLMKHGDFILVEPSPTQYAPKWRENEAVSPLPDRLDMVKRLKEYKTWTRDLPFLKLY
jgi:hypothetical protein